MDVNMYKLKLVNCVKPMSNILLYLLIINNDNNNKRLELKNKLIVIRNNLTFLFVKI